MWVVLGSKYSWNTRMISVYYNDHCIFCGLFTSVQGAGFQVFATWNAKDNRLPLLLLALEPRHAIPPEVGPQPLRPTRGLSSGEP